MIDNENIIKTVANGCEVTLLFRREPNPQAPANVLDMLLSSYEKRVEKGIENAADKY